MNFVFPNLVIAYPEIFVVCMACLVLVVDLYLSDDSRIVTYLLSQATLLGAAILTVSLHGSASEMTFNGVFISDDMSDVLKVFIYLITAVVFLYSREYLYVRDLLKGEFFILGLFAVTGMMVMVSAYSLLTLYLGLELLSLCLYAMVALHRDSIPASEAAMKYFVLGAIASGMLLYGMSMIYGATGSLGITEVGNAVRQSASNDIVLLFGLTFVVVARCLSPRRPRSQHSPWSSAC